MSSIRAEAIWPIFLDLYSRGEVAADDIDDFVDRWRSGLEPRAKELPLHEYLGLAREEYGVWVRDAGVLPAILEARRSARPLVDIIDERLDEMRSAGRPTDGTTIFTLGNWLKHRAGSGSDRPLRSQALG